MNKMYTQNTNALVITSTLIIPSAYLSYKRHYFLQSYGLLFTIFCSINFWRSPRHGIRRNMDLIISKIAFFYFLYIGYMHLYGYGCMICYPNLSMILFCYNRSNTLFINKREEWLYYHMIFHTLVGLQGYVITAYLPNI